jgi:tRNA (adenine57-N1/adenine58-N1)-methyltransferase
MADIVTLTHRNVCKDGFTVEDTVDAGMSLPYHPD